MEEKDIGKIAKYIGISKARLVSIVDMKKRDEPLLEYLKTITNIRLCLELYLMTPFGSEPEMATLTKLHELLSEMFKTFTTVEQVKQLYDEAKTDVEQNDIIWEIYKRF